MYTYIYIRYIYTYIYTPVRGPPGLPSHSAAEDLNSLQRWRGRNDAVLHISLPEYLRSQLATVYNDCRANFPEIQSRVITVLHIALAEFLKKQLATVYNV